LVQINLNLTKRLTDLKHRHLAGAFFLALIPDNNFVWFVYLCVLTVSIHRGVEETANVLNDIANCIKSDISESSAVLSRKEAFHTKQTVNVNQKLEEIRKLLKDIKISAK